MKNFRRLAIASTVATFILVTIGGVVRSTKSGLGCGTDWPDCSGQLIPSLHNRAVAIEYSHRLAASVVLVLLGALAVMAFRHFRRFPQILWASVGAFVLVVGQALLGALVVVLKLEAVSVVLHLGTAMALIGVLVYVVIASAPPSGGRHPLRDRSISRAAGLAAAAVWALLLSGSYVTGSDAGYVFPDWPLMNGALIPDLGNELYAIHFAHRALAALVGVGVGLVTWRVIRRKGDMPGAGRLAHAVAGGFAVEVLIGAANIWTQLNAAVVTAHLLSGALIWAGLVGIAVEAHPNLARATAEREPSRSGHPSYEPEAV